MKKRVNTNLDVDLLRKIKAIAAIKGKGFNDLLDDCMKMYVESNENTLKFKERLKNV